MISDKFKRFLNSTSESRMSLREAKRICEKAGYIVTADSKPKSEDYRVPHRPSKPGDETPSLDKIENHEITPDDLFTRPEYYLNVPGVESSELKKFMALVKKAQGKPDAKIKIYRGAPSGGKLNYGDWVTPFKGYARYYAYDNAYSDNSESKVYEYTVKASELSCDLNTLAEWGYFGKPIMGKEAK